MGNGLSFEDLLETVHERSPLDTAGPSPGPASNIFELWDKANANQWKQLNSNGKLRVLSSHWFKNADMYQKLTGETLLPKDGPRMVINGNVLPLNPFMQGVEEQKKILNQAAIKLAEAKKNFPQLRNVDELYEDTFIEMDEAEAEFMDSLRRADPFTAVVGSLLGGITGALQDDVNIALTLGTLPLGGGAGVAKAGTSAFRSWSTASQVFKSMAMEGAINAAGELAIQGDVAALHRERMKDYGWDIAMTNVVMAGGAGVALTGLLKGGPPLASKFFQEASNLKDMPGRFKNALKYLERSASIREKNPFGKVGEAVEEPHMKASETAYEKVARGEPLKSKDLPFDEAEFKKKAVGEAAEDAKLRAPIEKTDPVPIIQRVANLDQAVKKIAKEQKRLLDDAVNAIVTHPATNQQNVIDFFSKLGIAYKPSKDAGFSTVFIGGGTKKFKNSLSLGGFVDKFKLKPKEIASRVNNAEAISKLDDDVNAIINNPMDDAGAVQSVNRLLEHKNKRDELVRAEEEFKQFEEMEAQANEFIDRLAKVDSADELERMAADEFPGFFEHPELGRIAEAFDAAEQRLIPEARALSPDKQLPLALDAVEDFYAKLDSPEQLAAEEANFRTLVDANPELELDVDGRVVKLKELVEEMETDEKFGKEVTNCATGIIAQNAVSAA